jgi:hypothetical protein
MFRVMKELKPGAKKILVYLEKLEGEGWRKRVRTSPQTRG